MLLLSGYVFVSEVALNVADTFGRGVALLLSPEQFGKSLVAERESVLFIGTQFSNLYTTQTHYMGADTERMGVHHSRRGWPCLLQQALYQP